MYTSQRRSDIKEPLINKSNLGETKEKKKSMQSSQQNYNYENDKRKLNVASDPTYKSNAHVSMMRVSICFGKLCLFSKKQKRMLKNPKKSGNCLGNLIRVVAQMMTGIMCLLLQELVNVFLNSNLSHQEYNGSKNPTIL